MKRIKHQPDERLGMLIKTIPMVQVQTNDTILALDATMKHWKHVTDHLMFFFDEVVCRPIAPQVENESSLKTLRAQMTQFTVNSVNLKRLMF